MPLPSASTTYATWQDVQAVWRVMSVPEQDRATALLGHAGAVIRGAEGLHVAARLDAGTLDREVVKWVSVAMVKAVLSNPEGKRQEAIDDYSYTRDSTIAAGELYLTDQQRAQLAPAQASGAFTINASRAGGRRHVDAAHWPMGWPTP